MPVLADTHLKANTHRWRPQPLFDGIPRTLAGRRVAIRYRVPATIADAVAAMAGLGEVV